MPRPAYLDDEAVRLLGDTRLNQQLDDAVSGIRAPHALTNAIRGIRKIAYGDENATSWKPLPIVVSDRPDAMAIAQQQRQQQSTAPVLDTAPETPTIPTFRAEDFQHDPETGTSVYRPSATTPATGVATAQPASGQQVAAMSSGEAPQGGGKADQYAAQIAQVSREESVPYDVLAGLIDTESSGEDSVSPAGARGIMQVVPGQGFDHPGENAADPLTSIRQGARAVKAKYAAVGSWEQAGRAYFGYGTDAGGMTTDRYGQIYDANRARYQGTPTAAAPSAAAPSSAPAAATPAQSSAAGASQQMLTIRNKRTGAVSRVFASTWNPTDVTNYNEFDVVPDDMQKVSDTQTVDDTGGPSAGDQKRAKLAAAQGEMYRQPLQATQGDTAAGDQQPYDPRNVDQGAHETGYTDGSGVQPASGDASEFAGTAQVSGSDPIPTSPANDPGGAQFAAQDAYSTPVTRQNLTEPDRFDPFGGSSDPTADATRSVQPDTSPTAPTSTQVPVWDDNGQVIGYRQAPASAQRQSQQRLSDGYGQVSSTPGEPDYVPSPPNRLGDIGNTIATEGIAGPVGRGIANTVTRPLLGKPPVPDPGQPTTSIDRALVETGRSLGSNINAAVQGYQQGDVGQAALGALGIVGDLAPSTTLARQLNEMLPKADTPFGEIGAGDAVMAAALGHDAIRLGYGAIQGAGRIWAPIAQAIRDGVPAERFGEWMAANSGRVADADARVAEAGSTAAHGTLGVVTGNPLEANTAARGRVIPPDVADTLDFPVRVPTDPSVIRAIEAAGGSVDPDRGVNLNVIRYQGPEAHGRPATRSSTFYTADKPGAPSPYAAGPNAQTGGSDRIEAPTTYRSPLVLPDAPGDMRGFNHAMEQLGVQAPPNDAEIARLQVNIDRARASADMNRRYGSAPVALAQERQIQQMEQDLAALQRGGPLLSADIDRGIRQARAAGPPGSPERAQALKDLVRRYGGDESVIDDLLAVRGADDSESAWAIKENILAHNARAKGYDGVLTVQPHGADEAAVSAHPKVVAASKAVDEANTAAEKAADEHQRIYESLIPEQFRRKPGESFNDYYDRVRSGDRAAHERAIHDAQNHPQVAAAEKRAVQATDALGEASQAYVRAQNAAREELGGHKITELADFRESHNPTPATPTVELKAAYKRAKEAEARFNAASGVPYVEGTPAGSARAAQAAARRELDDATAALDALMNQTDTPPGYTLRSDIPRRGGETTVSGTAGVVPQGYGGTGKLGTVNRALGQGLASAASGGIGAQINQQSNPDDPYAGVKGFAAGVVAPPLIAHGAGRLARAFGRAAGAEGGALATFGAGPLQNLPGVKQAIAASQQRAARLAANPNYKPLDPLQWTGKLAESIGYSSMIGIRTATTNLLGNLGEPLYAAPKEVARGASRAMTTGNASALREPGEMAFGAAHGLWNAGGEMVDALLARGRYNSPDMPTLSQQTVNPILHAIATVPEVGGRVFSGLPDALFGSIARGAGEAREAAQIATNDGLRGAPWKQRVSQILADRDAVMAGNPPTNVQQLADAQQAIKAGGLYAKDQTFQNEVGKIGKGVEKVVRLGGPNSIIGKIVTPFFNTPWNMRVRMAERTPLGLAMNTHSRAGTTRTGFDKGYDAVVGTTLIGGMAYVLGSRGRVTGTGPDDAGQRALMRENGWTPQSTLVHGDDGQDYYVQNNKFGIYGPLLNVVGEVHDALAYGKKDATGREQLIGTAQRFGRMFENEAQLRGISDLLGAITDPAQHAIGYAGDLATRATPYAATMRDISTSQDTQERVTDRGKNVPIADEITQRWQSGTGQRSGLPVDEGLRGPRENTSPGIWAFFPKASTAKNDPVVQTFLNANVDIPRERQSVTADNKIPQAQRPAGQPSSYQVPLTPEKTRIWENARNRELVRLTESAFRNPLWDQMAPGAQQQLLQNYVTASAKAADTAILTRPDMQAVTSQAIKDQQAKASETYRTGTR